MAFCLDGVGLCYCCLHVLTGWRNQIAASPLAAAAVVPARRALLCGVARIADGLHAKRHPVHAVHVLLAAALAPRTALTGRLVSAALLPGCESSHALVCSGQVSCLEQR